MNLSLLVAASVAVTVLFVFASLNGIARETLYRRFLPKLPAVYLSIVLDIIAAWLICRILFHRLYSPPHSTAEVWSVGALWLFAGLFLELVVIGRLWMNKDWREMLAEFDPRDGSPNLLIPLTLLLMPVLVGIGVL